MKALSKQFQNTVKLNIKSTYSFSNLNNQSLLRILANKNPNQDAIRFNNQKQVWTSFELDRHSDAFAYGFVELGYKPGDKILFLLEKGSTTETIAAQLGAAKAGLILQPIKVNSETELESALNKSQAKCLFIQPNHKVSEQQNYQDLLVKVLPELSQSKLGSNLNTRFKNLSHVIQTGFYTIPGTFKYKQILLYATKNYNPLKLPQLPTNIPLFQNINNTVFSLDDLLNKSTQLRKKYNISEKDSVILAGDSKYPLAFAIGVLNSIQNGNNLILTGSQPLDEVNDVSRWYPNNVLLVDSDLVNQKTDILSEDGLKQIKQVLVEYQNEQSVDKKLISRVFNGKQVNYLNSTTLA